MRQHALRTAVTLYTGGTLDLETAARQAGVRPQRFLRLVEDLDGTIQEPATRRSRVPLGAD